MIRVREFTMKDAYSFHTFQEALKCVETEETKKVADDFYEKLQSNKVEVIYDDREGIRPGEMFADADLFRCANPCGCKSS